MLSAGGLGLPLCPLTLECFSSLKHLSFPLSLNFTFASHVSAGWLCCDGEGMAFAVFCVCEVWLLPLTGLCATRFWIPLLPWGTFALLDLSLCLTTPFSPFHCFRFLSTSAMEVSSKMKCVARVGFPSSDRAYTLATKGSPPFYLIPIR